MDTEKNSISFPPAPASPEAIACSMTLGDRSRGDACPGAQKMHHATDGVIGRLRFPGGDVSSDQWRLLADLARSFGDGMIHLTTRGNLQVRGIAPEQKQDFTNRVDEAGLIPSLAHDRMRNIVVSPRTTTLKALAHQLDDELLSREDTASLAGRTLFSLDDGTGDVQEIAADFGAIAHTGQDNTSARYRIMIAGEPTNWFTTEEHLPKVIADLAATWASIRGTLWRVKEDEAGDKRQQLHELIAKHSHTTEAAAEAQAQAATTSNDDDVYALKHVGWHDEEDGTVTLGVGIPFGKIPAQVAELFAEINCPTTVTCWHTVMLHHLDEAIAEAVCKVGSLQGLVFDKHAPALKITACTGIDGCDKSLADTQGDAITLIRQSSPDPQELPIHFSGCVRRCGHPRGDYVDYLATGMGEYEVTDPREAS